MAEDDQQQDLTLPIRNVVKIMKKILPPEARITKEAKETMEECAREFISFVTNEANENCRKEISLTINGDHICRALTALGFDEHATATLMYLDKYRELVRERNERIAGGRQDSKEEENIDVGASTLNLVSNDSKLDEAKESRTVAIPPVDKKHDSDDLSMDSAFMDLFNELDSDDLSFDSAFMDWFDFDELDKVLEEEAQQIPNALGILGDAHDTEDPPKESRSRVVETDFDTLDKADGCCGKKPRNHM